MSEKVARPRISDPNPFAPPLPVKEREKLRGFCEQAEGLSASAGAASAVLPCQTVQQRVTIDIQEAPVHTVLQQSAAGVTLHAVTRVPPAGGVLNWNVPNPTGVLNLPGALNQNTLPVTFGAAGSETVELTHTFAGQVARATVVVEVVGVAIQQAPSAAVVLHNRGANPNQVALTAVGAPAPGTYAWRIRHRTVVDFPGGAAPVNQPAIQVDTVSFGTTHVDVRYTHAGLVATDTITLDVIGVRIRQAPLVARAFTVAGALAGLDADSGPLGGDLGWNIQHSPVRHQNGTAPGRAPSIQVESVHPGSAIVDATYSAAGLVARDQVEVVFVGVQIQPSPGAMLMHQPGANPNQLAFQAIPFPGGGGFVWNVRADGRTRFLNGLNPGNSPNATVESQAPGRSAIGVDYTLHGIPANDSATVDVVGVTVAPSPAAMVLHRGANRNTLQLQATGAPASGIYTWTEANAAIARFDNPPGNNAQATVETVTAGTAQFDVDYTASGQIAHATVTVHVLDVRIQQAGPIAVLFPGAGNPTTIALQAQGTPGGGTYTWNIQDPNIVQFQGGAAPVNQANINVETAAPGATQVTVTYSLAGFAAAATVVITLNVVSLQLQAAPAAARLLPVAGQPPNTIQITAQLLPPLAGNYTWNIANHAIFRPLGGNPLGTGSNITIETVGAGTTQVDVQFPVAGLAAPAAASVTVHSVGVIITEGAAVAILLHAAAPPPAPPPGLPVPPPPPAPRRILHAVGTPAGGAATWQAIPGAGGVLQYSGGAATVNTLAAVVQGLATGARRLRVNYAYAGLTATATIAVNVANYSCSLVTWGPPIPAAFVDCPHGPDAAMGQVPQSGVAPTTAPPAHPHHHGEQCQYCQHNGWPAHHYVNERGAATAEVVTLFNEIHHLRGLMAAVPPNPGAVNAYILAHPWLQNVPAHVFDPAPGGAGQGRMMGVLMGRNAAGNWKLRAVSGAFPGVQFTAPRWGTPNAYWSRRLVNPLQIYSASRGVQAYPAHIWGNSQFGKCAASHLLSHALHLGLEVLSMAEIWIGRTNPAGRQNGQLVTVLQLLSRLPAPPAVRPGRRGSRESVPRRLPSARTAAAGGAEPGILDERHRSRHRILRLVRRGISRAHPRRSRGPDRRHRGGRFGRPLSDVHRSYLERLGEHIAWLSFGAFDTSAVALLAAHQATSGTIPPEFDLFAQATDEPYEDIFLVDRGRGAPLVEALNTRLGCSYDNLAGDEGTVIAGTLPEWICRQALRHFPLSRLALRAAYYEEQPTRPLLGEFDRIAESLRLEPLWFNNWMTHAVSRDSLVAVATDVPGSGLVVQAAATEPDLFVPLCEALERGLSLQRTEI